ncbi:phosphate acyltransferase PlsX [Guggenheimella bovis]
MRLGVDAMSGDFPLEIVKGVLEALPHVQSDIVLYGDENVLRERLNGKEVEIVDCKEVIEGEDSPVQAIREKRDSSMVRGLNDLKTKKIDGFLSAGNTGALLAGGLLLVGRLKGIDRPCIAPIYPMEGHIGMIADAGANADCKPENLRDFALMASLYAKKVLGFENPRVGLVNIGSERGKGNDLTKNAFLLLEENKHLNFIGSIEGRDIPEGKADIIICDGFTGNVIIKLTEGYASSFNKLLKELFLSNLLTKLFSPIYLGKLKSFKKRMDYTEYGGAPLLGVNGALVKAHGSSNSKAIKNGIIYMERYAKSGLIDDVKAFLEEANLE